MGFWFIWFIPCIIPDIYIDRLGNAQNKSLNIFRHWYIFIRYSVHLKSCFMLFLASVDPLMRSLKLPTHFSRFTTMNGVSSPLHSDCCLNPVPVLPLPPAYFISLTFRSLSSACPTFAPRLRRWRKTRCGASARLHRTPSDSDHILNFKWICVFGSGRRQPAFLF